MIKLVFIFFWSPSPLTGHIGGSFGKYNICSRLSCAIMQLPLPINRTLLLPKKMGEEKKKLSQTLVNFFLAHLLTQIRTFLALPNWKFSSLIFKLAFHNLNFIKRFQGNWWRNLAPNFRAKFGFVWSIREAASFGFHFGVASQFLEQGTTRRVCTRCGAKISTNPDFLVTKPVPNPKPNPSHFSPKFKVNSLPWLFHFLCLNLKKFKCIKVILCKSISSVFLWLLIVRVKFYLLS